MQKFNRRLTVNNSDEFSKTHLSIIMSCGSNRNFHRNCHNSTSIIVQTAISIDNVFLFKPSFFPIYYIYIDYLHLYYILINSF